MFSVSCLHMQLCMYEPYEPCFYQLVAVSQLIEPFGSLSQPFTVLLKYIL